MMPIQELQNMLESAFPGGQIHLSSPQGDNNHFRLVLISDRFDGKNMVEQHQLVYQALGDAMREAVHALSLKTFTPDQWAKSTGTA